MSAQLRICRFCDSPLLRTFVDLGCMPLANSYLTAEQLDEEEPRFPLHVRLCDECLLLQVDAIVSPADIFSNYAYFSSYSRSWVEHARRFSIEARSRLGLTSDHLVVEIASNDGYLLGHFADEGIPVLGIEPAANVAKVAMSRGIPTDTQFFGLEAARNLVQRGKRANLLVANNVLAHVPDLNDFVAGMAEVLDPEGTISIEVPHLLRLLQGTQFDTIYHEHLSYFSLLNLEKVLGAHGLQVFDVEELATHGGSLRLWVTHIGRTDQHSEGRNAVRHAEQQAGLDRAQAYDGFDARVQRCRDSVVYFLTTAAAEGKSVAAYGAAAKGNTLLNYCNISTDLVTYVVDRNPYKQQRYLPGSHLPVLAPEEVRQSKPDFLLILAWNLQEEIMAEMAFVRDWGGQFATPVPTVEIHP